MADFPLAEMGLKGCQQAVNVKPPAIGQQHQILQESDVILWIQPCWDDTMAPRKEELERIA